MRLCARRLFAEWLPAVFARIDFLQMLVPLDARHLQGFELIGYVAAVIAWFGMLSPDSSGSAGLAFLALSGASAFAAVAHELHQHWALAVMIELLVAALALVILRLLQVQQLKPWHGAVIFFLAVMPLIVVRRMPSLSLPLPFGLDHATFLNELWPVIFVTLWLVVVEAGRAASTEKNLPLFLLSYLLASFCLYGLLYLRLPDATALFLETGFVAVVAVLLSLAAPELNVTDSIPASLILFAGAILQAGAAFVTARGVPMPAPAGSLPSYGLQLQALGSFCTLSALESAIARCATPSSSSTLLAH